MSENYQVLARKYRPHTFAQMVGQKHTIKTLVNALNANNIHHGFLFTGTRGVGKTTIARIFAKSVNCETGVSSKPCGKCQTCLEIDKGQSVDLIEIDAASHTGVDNMRTILENARYVPTKNRYKIYLIDEVHMLSKSSFNALLKTLEEPPEHIKFLLATTDPQKLPVTIISRCLQFNLQKLTNDEILGQLKFIMQTEGLKFETSALSQIADFGNGSMRDALSLLDQSISYGNGKVDRKDIKAMLGLVLHDDIITLAQHLFNQDAKAVISFINDLSHRGENLTNALKDLTTLFHQIAINQIISDSQDSADIKELSNKISNQDLQIFYQIALNGIKDIALAPSEQIGFEMTLLRMLAFHSDIENTAEKKTKKISNKAKKEREATAININSQDDWEKIIQSLKFSQPVRVVIKNTLFDNVTNNVLTLALDKQFGNLLTKNIEKNIEKTIKENFADLKLKFNLKTLKNQTLAQKQTKIKNEKIAVMQKEFLADEGVQKLEKTFNTKIDVKSIRKIKGASNV